MCRFAIVGYVKGAGPGLEEPGSWRKLDMPRMAAAVLAFADWGAERGHPPPNQCQVDLLWSWCRYFIKAPCWRAAAAKTVDGGDLDRLTVSADLGSTLEDLKRFIEGCLAQGLDPL